MKPLHHRIATRLVAVTALLAGPAGPDAWAMDCPAPPAQSRKDWDTQVRAEVGRVGPVRGAELDLKLRHVTQDLMGKLPGADRVYLEQMMFSAYCRALRDDPEVSGAEKSKQILEYRRALDAAMTATAAAKVSKK